MNHREGVGEKGSVSKCSQLVMGREREPDRSVVDRQWSSSSCAVGYGSFRHSEYGCHTISISNVEQHSL